MPKTLADARLKVVILTKRPANPAAPTLTELNDPTAVDVSCRLLKSDYRISATASDTVSDAELCSASNAVTYGASNYEGNATPFRYLDAQGKPETAEDDAWDTLKEKGTTLWFVEREGPEYDTPFAAGDVVDVYEVITDTPQKPSDRSGFIKRTVPLGVQRAWEGRTVGGGVAATGVSAGAPGSFTPSGATPPATLAALKADPVIGDSGTSKPGAAWTTGQYVVLGDASQANWSGTAWASGIKS